MPEQNYTDIMLGKKNKEPDPNDHLNLAPNAMYYAFMSNKSVPDEIKVISSIETLDNLVSKPSDIFQDKKVVGLANYIKGDKPTVDSIEYKIAEDYWRKRLKDKEGFNEEDIKKYAKGSVNSLRKSKIYDAFKASIENKLVKGIDVLNVYKPILDYLSRDDVDESKKVNYIGALNSVIKELSKYAKS